MSKTILITNLTTRENFNIGYEIKSDIERVCKINHAQINVGSFNLIATVRL